LKSNDVREPKVASTGGKNKSPFSPIYLECLEDGALYTLACRMMRCQIRYDQEFFKFQADYYDLTAKFCNVIFVRMHNAEGSWGKEWYEKIVRGSGIMEKPQFIKAIMKTKIRQPRQKSSTINQTKGSHSISSWKPIASGAGAVLTLAGFFLTINLAGGSLAFAISTFAQLWMWLLPLTVGLGIQVGLFTHFRQLQKAKALEKSYGTGSLAASGSTSALAMAICCAHYLAEILPFVGIASLASVLGQYQAIFFFGGILSNVVGTVHLLRQARRHRLFESSSGWIAWVLRHDLERVFHGAVASSAIIFIVGAIVIIMV